MTCTTKSLLVVIPLLLIGTCIATVLWVEQRERELVRHWQEEVARRKNIAIALPAPPIESALIGDRYAVVGKIYQNEGRRGWDSAAGVNVQEWIGEVPAATKTALSGWKDGSRLYAYIPGREEGHPFPEGTVGNSFIVVVEHGPDVLKLGPDSSVINARCQLVGAYPLSPELLARVRMLVAERPPTTTSAPCSQQTPTTSSGNSRKQLFAVPGSWSREEKVGKKRCQDELS